MKKLLTPALCILFTFVIHAQTPLIPQPQSVRTDSGFFIIDHNLQIGYSSEPAPQLYQAFKRLRAGLNYRTGLWFEPEMTIGALTEKGINVIVERTSEKIID
jgi:hypothetical protein